MASVVMQRWQTRLSAFEELTSKWKSAMLPTLQREDDLNALLASVDGLSNSRKSVSSRTKAFAKLTSEEEKLAEVVPLVKLYQGHVDDLTRVLKQAEGLYVDLLRRVQKLTDPYPMMEKFAREKSTILDFIRGSEEVDKLRSALAEREAELQGLRNQEVTILELRRTIAAAELEKADAVQQSAAEASGEVQQLLREYQAREADYLRDRQHDQHEVRKWKLLHDDVSEQLAALRLRWDEAEAARERDIAALVEELEEMSVVAHAHEHNVQRLQAQLAAREVDGGDDARAPDSPHRDATESEPHSRHLEEEETPVRATSRAAQRMMLEEHVASLQLAQAQAVASFQQRESLWLQERRDLLHACHGESQRLNDVYSDRIRKLCAEVDGLTADLASQKAVIRQLNDDLSRARHSVRRAEAELLAKEELLLAIQKKPSFAAATSSSSATVLESTKPFSLEQVLEAQPPPSGQTSSIATASATATMDLPAPVDDSYLAIAGQRDKLRQRLLALEEASSSEIHRLQMHIAELRIELGKRDSVGSSSELTAGGTVLVSVAPSSTVAVDGDGDPDHNGGLRRPLLLFRSGPGSSSGGLNLSQESLVDLLDRGNMLLSRHVLSSLPLRRAFVGYLLFLHTYMFLSALYYML